MLFITVPESDLNCSIAQITHFEEVCFSDPDLINPTKSVITIGVRVHFVGGSSYFLSGYTREKFKKVITQALFEFSVQQQAGQPPLMRSV